MGEIKKLKVMKEFCSKKDKIDSKTSSIMETFLFQTNFLPAEEIKKASLSGSLSKEETLFLKKSFSIALKTLLESKVDCKTHRCLFWEKFVKVTPQLDFKIFEKNWETEFKTKNVYFLPFDKVEVYIEQGTLKIV